MTIGKVLRSLLALFAGLLVVWSLVDVGARLLRGHGASRKVTLTILHWGSPEEDEIVQKLVDEYEAAEPDVHIERLNASDYDPKLKTMFAAGTPPDLFYIGAERFAEFAHLNLLKNIDPYVRAEKAGGHGQWLDDFYPQLISAFRYDGTATGRGPLYGLPKDFTNMLMYVNVDLFKKAGVKVPFDGWTWDEYEADMKKISALSRPGDPTGRVYGGVLNTWPGVLRNIVWTYGGEYFGKDFADVKVGSPQCLAAYDLVCRTRFRDKTVFNATGIAQDGGQLFYTGKIGCIGPTGRWMTPRYRSITDFAWDVVPMPHAAEKASVIATVAWTMSARTQHPDEAFRLMKFLCGKDGQAMSARLGLAIPSLRSVATSDDFLAPGSSPAHAKIFLDEIPNSRLGSNPPYAEFDRIMDQEITQAIQLGVRTPAQAATAVRDRWLLELNSPLRRPGYRKMPWAPTAAATGALMLAVVAVFYFTLRRQKVGALEARQEKIGWLFISPWLLGFLALTLGPMVVSLLLSVTRWTALTSLADAHFVGLDNYKFLFQSDSSFVQAIGVTAYYALLAVPVGQAAGLAVALLMNSKVPGMAFFRTVYFVPSVVSGVALATLWLWIFNTEFGLLNHVLAPVFHLFGANPPDWFGVDARWAAVPGFVIMSLWGVGGGMVIYLAGLKGVPPSLYEAARLDGAGPVRQFINVTLPSISPLILFNLIMGIIGSFQVFTQAYVMTGDGPGGATRFYVLYLYRQAFEYHNMGYASAMAWVLFAAILLLTLGVMRGSNKFVFYEGLKA